MLIVRVIRFQSARMHDDPVDRPPEIFGGKVTLHFGPRREASVLLPVIPLK
jgi:uncharacterized protein